MHFCVELDKPLALSLCKRVCEKKGFVDLAFAPLFFSPL